MPLYVVKHQHPADRCPAADPAMGQMLLTHLSKEHAQQQGVTLEGEAVINDAHTLYVIAEAPDRATIERYMAPFAQAGSVDILSASSCDEVVARGGCGLVVP